jgi:hypothetical protein
MQESLMVMLFAALMRTPGEMSTWSPMAMPASVFVFGPDREPGFFVRTPQQGHMGTDADRATEQFDMPGLDDKGVVPEAGQVGRQVMAHIQVLEPVPGFFDVIGPGVPDHG